MLKHSHVSFAGCKLKSKNPYGLAVEKIARLRAIGQDGDLSLGVYFHNLELFTGIAIRHALELAKLDYKDDARMWYRFLNNSNIISILAEVGHDVAEMRADMESLSANCHPLDVPSFTNDLSAIKHCLREILNHVTKDATANEIVGRFTTGRGCLGADESFSARRNNPPCPSISG